MFLVGDTITVPHWGNVTLKVIDVGAHSLVAIDLAMGKQVEYPLSTRDYKRLLTLEPTNTDAHVSSAPMGTNKVGYVLPSGARVVLTHYSDRSNWTFNNKQVTATRVWELIYLEDN